MPLREHDGCGVPGRLRKFIVWAFALCAISFILLIVGAIWIHGDAQKRRMDATLWLILLIIATLFGNFIGFIIVFVAYLIVRENHPIGGGPMATDRIRRLPSPRPARCAAVR